MGLNIELVACPMCRGESDNECCPGCCGNGYVPIEVVSKPCPVCEPLSEEDRHCIHCGGIGVVPLDD